MLRYLNTDLDLEAAFDIGPLSSALTEKGLFQLHSSQLKECLWYASFETAEQFDTPEATISALLSIIDSLDIGSQQRWSECTVRAFNIGFECGEETRSIQSCLPASTIARIAATSASICITLYSRPKDG